MAKRRCNQFIGSEAVSAVIFDSFCKEFSLVLPQLVHVALVRADIGKTSVPALPSFKKKAKNPKPKKNLLHFNFG